MKCPICFLYTISIWLAFTQAKTLIGKNGDTIERIIGGNIAFAGQFPYIAAIFINTDDGTYFCGGALMNHQWILTAGHCVNGAILFTIYLGTNHLESSDSTSLKLATDYYILHPDFNLETLENDIGLIKLRMSITFTDYIKPIDHLPTYELLPNAGGIMTLGWGQTSDEASGLVDELNYVFLIPISNEECRLYYGNQIKDKMICAVGMLNEGSCLGDSGSPLVKISNGPRTAHMAVASFVSQNGCEGPEPSGFTRTYPYVDWIRNVTDIE